MGTLGLCPRGLRCVCSWICRRDEGDVIQSSASTSRRSFAAAPLSALSSCAACSYEMYAARGKGVFDPAGLRARGADEGRRSEEIAVADANLSEPSADRSAELCAAPRASWAYLPPVRMSPALVVPRVWDRRLTAHGLACVIRT
jgi:hypothetical protein